MAYQVPAIAIVLLVLTALLTALNTYYYVTDSRHRSKAKVRARVTRGTGGVDLDIKITGAVQVIEHGIAYLDDNDEAIGGDPLWPGDVEDGVRLHLLAGERPAFRPIGRREAELRLPDGQGFAAWITWTGGGRPGDSTPALVALWTSSRRRIRRAPIILTGAHAEMWIAHFMGRATRPASAHRGRWLRRIVEIFAPRRGPASAMASTYFTSLRIEGLRGFGDAQVLELAVPTGAMGSGLTIVVGANNSGKSSIVEAFDAVYRATRHQSVSFSADRRHAGAKQRVSIALYREDGRSVGVESLRAGTSEARATWDGTATGETFRIDVTAVPARRQFSAYFGRYGDGDRGWASMSAEYSRSENRDEFVGRLFALHADENRLRTFNTLLAEVTGRALSWEIDLGQQQQYFLRFSEHEGGSHTSDGLGDGLISLLFILDALHDSSPESLIVIDEPELSLHPQYVARLGAVLTRFAADRQIVFATHAPALVDWQNISRGARICRVYKTHGRSFIAQPSTSTTQEIASGHLSNTNNPHVFGPAGNEVFFQEDGLLVLEGQEDVIFLPAVASSLGASLIGNTFGWGAGGAARIRSILTLFRELHFSRVAVLLDGDPQTRKTAEALQREFPEYKIATHPAHDIRTKPAQRERPERIGLLDSDGSTVRPAYREGARAALTEIGEYLSSRESSSLDPDSV